MGVIRVDLGRVEGKEGPPGQVATIRIGTVTMGDTPQVINTGSPTNAVLNFVLPSAPCEKQVQAAGPEISGESAEHTKEKTAQADTQAAPTERDLSLEDGFAHVMRTLEAVTARCEVQPAGLDTEKLLQCFQPMKGVDEKGITHYGFLAGKAEQNLLAMGQDPEKIGIVHYEEKNGRAQRWLAFEELLAVTVGAVLALGRRMTEWEEGGTS